jgi:hypothetical protein
MDPRHLPQILNWLRQGGPNDGQPRGLADMGHYQDFDLDAEIARNRAAKTTANKFLHQGYPPDLRGMPTPRLAGVMEGGGWNDGSQKMPDVFNTDRPATMQKIPPAGDPTNEGIQQLTPWTPKYLMDALKGPGWESIQ